MKVYKAISAVQSALAKVGIAKDSRNQVQNFNFRGIDAVYNTMAPILSENHLCILPRMLSRTCEERVNAKGTALFYVTVEAEFDLVSAEDGSKHTIKTFGEAMDSGDKATNKAMSAAYKYACFQAFAIPTEGDNDADSHTHEVVAKPRLESSVVDGFVISISSAASMDDLKTAYAQAYKAAAAAADNEAIKRFSAAKDKRKAELEVGK